MPFRSRLFPLTTVLFCICIALQAQPFTLGISIGLTPTSASLSAGQSKQFSYSLMGTNNAEVMWSVTPAVGSLTDGLYTAPSVVTSPTIVTLTVISLADYSKSASASIALTQSAASPAASGGVSVNPPSASLMAGQSQKFTANTSVNWSLSPAIGSIANGLYTAPASISLQQTIVLKATSVADPTKVATAFVSLMPNFTPAPAPAPASTPSPFPSVTLSLSPSSASLSPGQSTQFVASVSGTNNMGVAWALSPAVGTLMNGSYTAPAAINVAQTVVVTATSLADPSRTANATITLAPNSPAPGVASSGVSLSPSFASITPGQSQKFSFMRNGALDSDVMWALIPMIGSMTDGLYSAPVMVGSQTTVTVIATSLSDPTKSASAAVLIGQQAGLAPSVSVGVGVTPTSISLSAGKSSQFTASVTGTANTAVTWSLTPPVGTISNGVYTAPGTLSSAQTITLTATSVADPSKLAQAFVSLVPSVPSSVSVSPSQTTLAPGQSQQFFASVSGVGGLGGGGVPAVQWSISPMIGSISATGMYSAPVSLSTSQTVSVVASVLNVASSASVVVQGSAPAPTSPTPTNPTPPTQPAPNPPPSSGAMLLPLEVMGGDGTTQAASFSLPSSANLGGQLKLWAQIHGLKYQTEASVQINGGAWIPINDSTATLLGQADLYGGIGGGFGTLKLTLNLPSGSVHSGANTLTFRFNQSDGTTSGFRVLNLNILDASGTQLIPQSSFAWDNPATWQAPLNNSTDIQAGQNLWRNANLTAPGMGSIRAKCASCHPQDGRDLKYFNYSNLSIRVRSQFHGLTAQQGDQIASYIRSLNAPAPSYARPWNPPYQPGPGRDSTPVSEWAAGAGLDAVLDKDADMLPYVIPGGSTAKWAGNSYLNAREIPVNYQLLDWNRWLPTIHPLDAWGDSFTSSGWYQLYLKLRTQLVPNDPAAYVNVAGFLRGDMHAWLDYSADFGASVKTNPNWNDPVYVAKAYSISLWSVVKMWELHQEYGLEGMSRAVFGPQAADRAWNSNALFYTGPGVTSIPRPSPGIGNGRYWTHVYHSFMWYQLQLLLNDGNGTSASTWPIDWPYSLGYPGQDWTWDPTNRVAHIGSAAMMALWRVKALQNENDSTTNATNPGGMAGFPAISSTWSEVSTSQKLQILNAYTAAWFGKYGHMTHAQLSAGPLALPASNDPHQSNLGSETALMLARLRYQGVDITLLNQIAAWAATVWPGYNWTGALNGPCSPANFGEVFCTVP
jgi:hypothetical protein